MNKQDWNIRVKELGGSFLQSWEWGEFQERHGHTVKRFEDGPLVMQGFIHKQPFSKSYFYIPHAPMGESFSQSSFQFFVNALNEIAKEKSNIFIKAEPLALIDVERIGFKRSKKDIQPKTTSIVNLNRKERDLLAGMRKNTRYGIRLATRNGVVIEELDKNEFEKIWPLFTLTASEGNFRLYPFQYYADLLTINEDLKIKVFIARHQNKYLAMGIFAFWNDTVYFLHGASSREYGNLMGPYLMHWEIMTQAKKLGYRRYDFWGVDDVKYPGVSQFKRGFGGETVNRLGAYDFTTSSFWHKLYTLSRFVKHLKRF